MARAEILGTEFDFIYEEEKSMLELHEGKVKFTSLKTGNSRIMTAGDELIVIQTGEMTEPFSNRIKLFTIVDSKTGRDLKIVNDGDKLSLSDLPSNFNMKAYLEKPQELRFKVNGEGSKTEQNPPYFVAGNEVEPFSIHPWRIGPGTHKVEVEFMMRNKVQFKESLTLLMQR